MKLYLRRGVFVECILAFGIIGGQRIYFFFSKPWLINVASLLSHMLSVMRVAEQISSFNGKTGQTGLVIKGGVDHFHPVLCMDYGLWAEGKNERTNHI